MSSSFEEDVRRHRICEKWRAKVDEYIDWLRKNGRKKKDSDCTREEYCREKELNRAAFCFWIEYIKREDEFTFYASFASEHLRRAKKSLELLGHYIDTDPDLRMPLIRDAIVSYAALFHRSQGRVINFKLDETFVPDDFRETHRRVYEHRDVIIAHCDLRPRNPRVAPFGVFLKGAGFYWEDYLALLQPFNHLIDAVQVNLDNYLTREGLATPELAFHRIQDPPSAALEDPEIRSV